MAHAKATAIVLRTSDWKRVFPPSPTPVGRAELGQGGAARSHPPLAKGGAAAALDR